MSVIVARRRGGKGRIDRGAVVEKGVEFNRPLRLIGVLGVVGAVCIPSSTGLLVLLRLLRVSGRVLSS